MLSRFHLILERHGQTNRQTDRQICYINIACHCQYADARYWYSNSVCPSVCPWRSSIRWKRLNILSQFYFHHTVAQSLPASNIFTKFRRRHLLRGAIYRWGIKILRFSTNKSLYLANDTRCQSTVWHASTRFSYGARIGLVCERTKKPLRTVL